MNRKLFLRNPEDSDLGRRIIKNGITLIHEIGFEALTFKKLSNKINTTEAGVYRYFENKHRLLLYVVDWYWSWQEYRLVFHTNNMTSPKEKIKMAIKLLSDPEDEVCSTDYINEKLLYEIVMAEGAKSFLTKHVAADNKDKLFKPYKDLSQRIAASIKEYNPEYAYPNSLASTIIGTAHFQKFYSNNLPSLTDFAEGNKEKTIVSFLEKLVFTSIEKKPVG